MSLQNVVAVDHGKVIGGNAGGTAVVTFTVASTDWVTNAGSDAAAFPYIVNIETNLYASNFTPAEVLLLGSDPSDYPTATEQEAIQSVDQYIKFTASGIRLRATSAPASALTLVVRG
jgi:hypothetical protein